MPDAQGAALEDLRAAAAGAASPSAPLDELLAVVRRGLPPTPPPTQRIRTAVQGLTSGFGEEIEAAVRAAIPGGREYAEIRDDLRQKLSAYKQANPGESLIIEATGAVAPVVAAFLTGGPPGSGVAATSAMSRMLPANRTLRAAAVGGAEGAASGYGYSEADTPRGVLRDVATGAATGAAVSPVLGMAARGLGLGADALVSKAREVMGDKPATAVQAELLRIAADSGKGVDEIVNDLLNGRIMADNRTLAATIRAYRSAGGAPAAEISARLPARSARLKQEAEAAAQEALVPGTQGNVYAARQLDDKALKDMENAEYRAVFSAHGELDADTSRQLEGLLQRFPDARAEMDKVYRNSERLVPLYTTDPNGAVRMTRMPTLEDAEIVRRALDESASAAYRAGSGMLGESYKDAAGALRGALDSRYPDLQSTRRLAAERRTARDLFDEGRRVFNMPPDQLEYEYRAISQDPVKLRAFRAGVMDALRTKMRGNSVQLAAMGDPERKFGAILQTVFPDESADALLGKLAQAGESREVRNTVMGGSMTQPERAAGARVGTAPSVEEGLRAMSGDPVAVIGALRKALGSRMPGLTERQRLEVVKLMFSEDPEFVRRALTDDTGIARLVARAERMAAAMGAGGQRAGVQAGVQYTAPPRQEQQQ